MNSKKETNLNNKAKHKMLHKNLNFAAAEAYKLLRTNLAFTLSDKSNDCRVIGVTSSIRSEGKSVTSVNLSYSLAESGKKVLLIDADMRLPTVGKKMDMANSPGLSNILVAGDGETEIQVRSSKVSDKWFVLTSGDIPPNPNELLGSNRMKLLLSTVSERFDYIIVDLPPVNIVSDALAVSPYLDGILVVMREGYTEKKTLHECLRQLKMVDAKVLGLVMNDSHEGGGKYGRHKRYASGKYGYGYGYNGKK